MTNSERKKHIVKILTKMLETNLELMIYYRKVSTDEQSRKICRKQITATKKALEILPKIKHYEIVETIYNSFISNNVHLYVVLATYLNKKELLEYDNSEEKFQEFLELKKKAQEEAERKQQEEVEQRKIIDDAKKQGKKVEMVLMDGKLTPMIVEETNNTSNK